MASYISSLDVAPLSAGSRRTLVLLGSTGSIGTSTLQVVEEHPDSFQIVGLAGARNIKLLAEQAMQWRPQFVGVLDGSGADTLRSLLPGEYKPEILVGPEGYVAMATLQSAEMVVAAQVGAAGLPPALAAAKAGKIIALANKEALVLAGDLIRNACAKSGAIVLPVDSEHNALFQALSGHRLEEMDRLILTASGGPFRGKDMDFLAGVTPEQALKHPNWSMGAKISIDSATLMNKGLEVIEAYQLFGVAMDRIEVVVHPQSIVHSLVAYQDGSLLGHLGQPDMRIPISYCMAYPNRLSLSLEPLDLVAMGSLTFEAPDLSLFPCLGLAKEAVAMGPDCPVVLNAANEVSVAGFLEKCIGFTDIPRLIEKAMDAFSAGKLGCGNHDERSLASILDLDQRTRSLVKEWF